MKHLLATTALILAAGSAHAEGKLSLYHWFEYIPQELLDKFAAEYGVEVTLDTYDSNEAMLAALKAGKLGQYDLAVPGDYMVEIMRVDGLLDSFTPAELPNFGNIAPEWVDVPFDPGREHSIPYQWGATAFSVNRDVYDGPIDSLGVIFTPPDALKGKINVLDSQGEVLALGSIFLGIPQCSTDRAQLQALNDMLLAAKPDWASFGSDTAKDVLVSGDAAAGMIYNGFSAKARAEGANVEYAWPKEGYVVWMDNVVLLKDAPNRDNALKFMNFLLEPENAAAVTNYAAYAAGVTGVEPFLDEAIRTSPENNPPEGARKGQFVQACDEASQKMYDAIWTNLKK
ncbi:MAG: extracellular solute-binding protein [Rhodobacteraceae bacterium]|nr:extracellular solute-binding protein [Paracoccaceae bacterium]